MGGERSRGALGLVRRVLPWLVAVAILALLLLRVPADALGDALERTSLPLLAALGNMATMLGLLGTVLGMIESFDLIAKTGTGDARVVAEGIFQALVTTAAGLMVGLVAIGAHSLLRRKAELLEVELVEKASRMLEDLWLGREAAGQPQGEAREQAAG